MAGNTRFDLASGSPEGSAFATPYPNGQRGNRSGSNLDRLGSFREGVENRMLSSGSTSSRGSTTISIDMPPLSQCLMLEPITLADQKFTRSGELRRFISVSLGNTSVDHSFGPLHHKPPTPLASEELKRLKTSLFDASTKARERTKRFHESIVKLDKFRHTFNSRKRRAELSSNDKAGGANLLRMGNQIQQNPLDLVNQRLDDRTKKVVSNRRVRTSLVESEGRNNTLSRQTGVMDKDRDNLKSGNGSLVQDEQKIRAMPAGGEGWDKKMKRKRSVGMVTTRNVDSNQELKRKMHHKLSNDPRPRSSDSHGLGSGHSIGVTGINKLDVTSQLTNSNVRAMPRTELENVSLQTERRESAMGLEKERVVAKGNNKLGFHEDSQVGGHSPVTKGKISRAPRTGFGVTSSSPNPSTPEAPDVWEQPSCLNKVQSLAGVNNRKRPLSTESSSPPVAQWGGQRPQKISRTRRTNLVSPVPNHEEAQLISDGNPISDIGSRLTSNDITGSELVKGVFNKSQQFKMKTENFPSPARLSESLESGASENNLKEKHMDFGEIEDRSVNAVKKVGSFISSTKKNKLLINEEMGDGVRRQGRSGRGTSLSRACVPGMREKLENPATAKPLRSMRLGSDKNESKPGRPRSKKFSDRKAVTRPGHALNSGSSDFTGESDDDREELLVAANSAHNSSYLACSGSFWKKVEPIFTSVSSEDTANLTQQLHFVEELNEYFCNVSDADHNVLCEVSCKEEPVSQPTSEEQGCQLKGIRSNKLVGIVGSSNKLMEVDTLSGKLDTERRVGKVTPLYQRVLSALIEEDNFDEFDHVSETRHEFSQCASDDSPSVTCVHMDFECKYGDMMESEVESEVHYRTRKNYCSDSFSSDTKTANNSFRNPTIHNTSHDDELWQGDDDLVHSKTSITSGFGENHLDTAAASTNSSVISSSDCQYQLLSLDDKLVLELQSIGLYPERVPDLAEGGEEEKINKDILVLKKGLYGKVRMKKGKLCKLNKVVLKGREVEGRDLEQIAMNKLVEIAYKKQMACRGSNASRGGINKVSKQAALAFAKRTIARCRKFEDSGRSCFSEPALQDVILSAPPFSNRGSSVDNVHPRAAANTHVESQSSQLLSGVSATGAVFTAIEKHGGPSVVKSERGLTNSFQRFSQSSDPPFSQYEPISNRKKREVLLEDVGSAVSRVIPVPGNSHSGGTKGRRSERDREQNKQIGNPKSKAKQKIVQLSTSGNGLLGKISEPTSLLRDSSGTATDGGSNALQNSSKETEESAVFGNLHLNELDTVDWLNFDEDGLQDHDSIGLEIPMDDLTGLSMLM